MRKIKRASWLLPLLLVYIVTIILYAHAGHDLRIDEGRYVSLGRQLVRGGYQPGREPGLWSGPGYRLLLVPFIVLHLPWLIPRLANAVILFLAFIYLHRLLATYVPKTWAYVAVYCVGLYPVLLEFMPRLMTEQLSILLVCGFAFHFSRVCRSEEGRFRNMIIAAAFLGYLALTKVLFGYVIATGIIIYSVVLVLAKRRTVMRTVIIYCLALLICVPYLVYTHSRTGKAFYWATSGGLSLYWMSNPHEGEYGDWLAGTKPWLKRQKAKNHLEFLDTLRGKTAIERDDALKEQALKNITNHPAKFAKNWVANLGRLFCDYPYSYERQKPKTYFKLIPGIILLFLSAVSLIPAWAARRRIPYEVGMLSVFGLIYVGGSSLLSAYNRMLLPVVPLFALWICLMISELAASRR